jgi:replicative DNA helicase
LRRFYNIFSFTGDLNMNREQAKAEVKQRWREIIPTMAAPAKTKANHEISWICPLCNHGANGDGLTVNPKSIDQTSLKCFGSCNFSGDIIDLTGRVYNIGFNDAFKKCADILNITIDRSEYTPYTPTKEELAAVEPKTSAANRVNTSIAAPAAEELTDYTTYYSLRADDLRESEEAQLYLINRGISYSTATAYNIGYDANWKSPKALKRGANPPASKRIILPSSKNHYVARAIDLSVDKKYQKMNEGSADIFNKDILLQADTKNVFVVEGIFDALSVIETGAAAIALNSTSNAEKLVKHLKDNRKALPKELCLLLALDNDESGEKAAELLRQELDSINISYMPVNINADECKDANESLVKVGLEAYTAIINKAAAAASAKPDGVSSYIDSFMADDIQKFKKVIKTGFDDLDKQSGGLYAGLYVIAAGTSLGKTTFALQLADQVAAAGNDVLFFSLEQSRLELVSKSIARTTAQRDMNNAVTSLAIRRGYLPQHVLEAAEEYKNAVQDRLSVIEGNFDCNISFIGDYIKNYIKRNSAAPVVIIDYLQILQPAVDEHGKTASTKETVDATITELKRISRSLNITIFVISSVNRANYLTPIDYESLKESGGIEYTADVIWGLQLQCLNESLFSETNKIKEKRARIKAAKAASPRQIELVCLKNRYGIANYSTCFDYVPANDLYINTGAAANEDFTDDIQRF